MICKSCGAEYKENQITCPFCGAENVEEAYRRQEDYVDRLRRKSEFLARLPEWCVKIIGNAMKHFAIIGAVFFVVVLIIAFLVVSIQGSMGVRKMERNLAKLEKLYDKGDYEKLSDFYWDLDDTYGGSYEKYYRTISVYNRTEWVMYQMEKLSDDYVEYITEDEMDSMLQDLVKTLYEIEEMEKLGFIYEEGEAMLEFRKILMDGVREHIPMSEVEFQAAYDTYLPEEDNDYSKEAQLILQRAIARKSNRE